MFMDLEMLAKSFWPYAPGRRRTMEQTIKCPICGEPYKVYSHMAGDQSACPDCQRKANEKRGTWKRIQ
jgi:transposase-like protein